MKWFSKSDTNQSGDLLEQDSLVRGIRDGVRLDMLFPLRTSKTVIE